MSAAGTKPAPEEEARLPDQGLRAEQKHGFAALACPTTGQSLRREGDALVTPDGAYSYPIVREIPRFDSHDRNDRSTGFERGGLTRSQLDRFRDDHSSEIIFLQKTGLTPGEVRGKLVLNAGVGAGRFADVLARWGASVVGVDPSDVVEAAGRNFAALPNVLVCQAEFTRLPFRPGTFDHIVSIDTLNHTPDTKHSFQCLPRLLKAGGEIAVWVAPEDRDHRARDSWIPFTRRLPARWFHSFCKVFVPWALKRRETKLIELLRRVFPFSDQGLGLENDILDTFDGLSPRYHGLHTPEEVKGWFRECGLADLREYAWATAVRGRRPAA